jgi:uncharacterized protein (DUF58 family)
MYWLGSGAQYWFQRRFTPAGIGLIVALIAVSLLGPDSDNNVAYQAVSLIAFLLLFSLLYSFWFRARFSAARIMPRFGTVGVPLSYLVRLKNEGKRAQSGLAVLDNIQDPRPSFEEWLQMKVLDEKQVRSFRIHSGSPQRRTIKPALLKEGVAPVIGPKQEGDARMELTPLKRGILRLSSITLARPDPAGLFRAFVRVKTVNSTLVLPKRYPLPAIELPGSFRYQAGGIALASRVGQSDEFVALRDYRTGDPMRHIHWRSWAKTGKPVIREFEDEFFVRHALVLDTFISDQSEEIFEEAVSVAASFACSLQTQESLLDLLFAGTESYCFTAGRGLGGSDQMLEILASVKACRDAPFSNLEKLVLDHVESVSGVVAVLLGWNRERRIFIKKIRTMGVPVIVLVICPAGQSARITPEEEMQDDRGHFHVLELGHIEENLQNLV